MFTCRLCHFLTELDDVALDRGAARCICLLCYERHTQTLRPMPRRLRDGLITILAAFEALEARESA
jgi:hypothetical protein